MNLSKMTDDLNIIQTLADQPTLNSAELKKAFDDAGNKIKNFINDILLKGIEEGVATDLESMEKSITKNVNESMEELKSDLEDTLSSFEEEISKKVEESTKVEEYSATLPSGVTVISQRIIKNNNMVNIWIEMHTNIPKETSGYLLFSLPEEIRPKNKVNFLAFYRNGSLNITDRGDGNWHEVETIDTAGQCRIDTANTGIQRVDIMATYTI